MADHQYQDRVSTIARIVARGRMQMPTYGESVQLVGSIRIPLLHFFLGARDMAALAIKVEPRSASFSSSADWRLRLVQLDRPLLPCDSLCKIDRFQPAPRRGVDCVAFPPFRNVTSLLGQRQSAIAVANLRIGTSAEQPSRIVGRFQLFSRRGQGRDCSRPGRAAYFPHPRRSRRAREIICRDDLDMGEIRVSKSGCPLSRRASARCRKIRCRRNRSWRLHCSLQSRVVVLLSWYTSPGGNRGFRSSPRVLYRLTDIRNGIVHLIAVASSIYARYFVKFRVFRRQRDRLIRVGLRLVG